MRGVRPFSRHKPQQPFRHSRLEFAVKSEMLTPQEIEDVVQGERHIDSTYHLTGGNRAPVKLYRHRATDLVWSQITGKPVSTRRK